MRIQEIEKEHKEVADKIRELQEVKLRLMREWVELNPNGENNADLFEGVLIKERDKLRRRKEFWYARAEFWRARYNEEVVDRRAAINERDEAKLKLEQAIADIDGHSLFEG